MTIAFHSHTRWDRSMDRCTPQSRITSAPTIKSNTHLFLSGVCWLTKLQGWWRALFTSFGQDGDDLRICRRIWWRTGSAGRRSGQLYSLLFFPSFSLSLLLPLICPDSAPEPRGYTRSTSWAKMRSSRSGLRSTIGIRSSTPSSLPSGCQRYAKCRRRSSSRVSTIPNSIQPKVSCLCVRGVTNTGGARRCQGEKIWRSYALPLRRRCQEWLHHHGVRAGRDGEVVPCGVSRRVEE